MGFTNQTTGFNAADGFQIVLTFDGTAEIQQRYFKPIRFFTPDAAGSVTERMRIMHGSGFIGINTPTPGNKVEINSDDASDTPGNSGLRFTDLTTNSDVGTNLFTPIPAVLSVDADGNVILVEDEGGAGGADDDWFDATTNLPPTSTGTNSTIYHLGEAAVGATTVVDSRFYTVTSIHTNAGNFENTGSCKGTGKASVGVRGFSNNIEGNCAVGVHGEVPSFDGYGVFSSGKLGTTDGALTPGVSFPSNTFIKKDTLSFTSGLDVLRQLSPLQYKYNGLFGFDTTETYFGILSDDLQNIDSNAVTSFVMPFDTTGTTLNGVKLDYILYTSVNAIKQLDSTVTTLIPAPVPQAPDLISPADGTSGIIPPVTLVWHAAANATSYTLELASDSIFTQIFEKVLTKDTFAVFAVTASFALDTVYWRVNANNESGVSPWSEVWHFVLESEMAVMTEVAFESASDSIYKMNIGPIDNPLDKLMQINGISYDWKTNAFPNIHFDDERHLGFIAQEVLTVFPEVIGTDKIGNYSLDYSRLVPVLVEALKEIVLRIDTLHADSLNARLSAVEACINSLPPGLCGSQQNKSTGNGNSNGNSNRSKTASVLHQNKPNPFSEQTEIRYYIPEEAGKGTLIIYDLQGKQVKKFEDLPQGDKSIQLPAKTLYAGMFIYTLIVDGEDIGTKRMILTE